MAMKPIYDKTDIQIGECDYEEGGLLLCIRRDGFTRHFVFNYDDLCYVERECTTPKITLTSD